MTHNLSSLFVKMILKKKGEEELDKGDKGDKGDEGNKGDEEYKEKK